MFVCDLRLCLFLKLWCVVGCSGWFVLFLCGFCLGWCFGWLFVFDFCFKLVVCSTFLLVLFYLFCFVDFGLLVVCLGCFEFDLWLVLVIVWF